MRIWKKFSRLKRRRLLTGKEVEIFPIKERNQSFKGLGLVFDRRGREKFSFVSCFTLFWFPSLRTSTPKSFEKVSKWKETILEKEASTTKLGREIWKKFMI